MPFQQRPQEKPTGSQAADGLSGAGAQQRLEHGRKSYLQPKLAVTPFGRKGRKGRSR